MKMQNSMKVEIYNDGKYYCARGIGFDVFTQGKTLDELVKNLREALTLYLEDEEVHVKSIEQSKPVLTLMVTPQSVTGKTEKDLRENV